MKADLHCHTSISDGTLAIEDLLIQAKSNGLDKIAITDHDCIASSVRGFTIAKRIDGFEVIKGVELSATDSKRGDQVHILCYLPDAPERLEMLCRKNTALRIKAGQIMAKRVSQKYNIPGKYIASCAQGANFISPLHIMKALMNCGYTVSIFGELYDKLFTKGTDDYIGVNPIFPDPREIIEEIHGAGGIAVLAHPGFFNNFELLEELTAEGILDGVEIYHPFNSEEQQKDLIKFASEHDLLMTGGTDFHGAFNMDPICIGDYCPPEDQLAALMSYKSKKARKRKQSNE